MQRLNVTFRREARADLADIYKYVRQLSQSAEVARNFTLRIRDRCKRIGDAPHGGANLTGVQGGRNVGGKWPRIAGVVSRQSHRLFVSRLLREASAVRYDQERSDQSSS